MKQPNSGKFYGFRLTRAKLSLPTAAGFVFFALSAGTRFVTAYLYTWSALRNIQFKLTSLSLCAASGLTTSWAGNSPRIFGVPVIQFERKVV